MITAIIPVREGSRRLKNKNVAPFAGTNLLINKINQLKQVKEITNIVVSSDSDNMLEMARLQGVSTHKRAVEFCDEKSKTFGEVVAHICENVDGDDILWATCTAPLVFPKQYKEAISLYYKALEDGYELIKVQTPVLLTAIKELNEPRYMNVRYIFDTANKEIQLWSADNIEISKDELGLKGSPTKVKKTMTKETKGAGELINEAPQEAVKYVLGKLKEKHYI